MRRDASLLIGQVRHSIKLFSSARLELQLTFDGTHQGLSSFSCSITTRNTLYDPLSFYHPHDQQERVSSGSQPHVRKSTGRSPSHKPLNRIFGSPAIRALHQAILSYNPHVPLATILQCHPKRFNLPVQTVQLVELQSRLSTLYLHNTPASQNCLRICARETAYLSRCTITTRSTSAALKLSRKLKILNRL